MFQFGRFAPYKYGLPVETRRGYPIRTSADHSFNAAPRSLSQLSTSFIATACQGIHRVPFLTLTCMACTNPRLKRQLNAHANKHLKGLLDLPQSFITAYYHYVKEPIRQPSTKERQTDIEEGRESNPITKAHPIYRHRTEPTRGPSMRTRIQALPS